MHDRDRDTSLPAGSWGRFAGRMYYMGDRYNSSSPTSNERKDSVWLYVVISVIYFFLIAVILLILLLAPRYRPPAPPAPTAAISGASPIQAGESQAGGGVSTGKDDVDVEDVGNSESKEDDFAGSPKDPLYDIDPRSSIFRGETHRWKEVEDDAQFPESRMRMNSKLLQV